MNKNENLIVKQARHVGKRVAILMVEDASNEEIMSLRDAFVKSLGVIMPDVTFLVINRLFSTLSKEELLSIFEKLKEEGQVGK